MNSIRASEDIVPVSDFKAHTADWLKKLATTGRPVVITQNGKAAGVVVSPAEYDRLMDHSRLMAAVEAGLKDDAEGRVLPHDKAVQRVMAKLSR